MPLFAASLSRDTQYQSGFEATIVDNLPTTNYHNVASMLVNYSATRAGNIKRRGILAFDLSDLENRIITSATLTMKTVTGFGLGSATVPMNIYKLTTPVVYDEVTWNQASNASSSAFNGGDGHFDSNVTATILGHTQSAQVCTSSDLSNVLAGTEGGIAYLIVKTAETSGTAAKGFISHDEDDSTPVADLPTLNIISVIDHKNVYDKHEMTKYMNKSVGLKGKSSVPSVG